MRKKEDYTFYKDTPSEGREKADIDVDRMINEGMAGGNVYSHHQETNIKEYCELSEEEPPNIID